MNGVTAAACKRGVGYVFRDRRGGRIEGEGAKRAWNVSGGVWSIAYQDVDGRLRRERTNAKTKTLAERILADRQDAVERARLQGLPTVDDLLRPAPAVTFRQFVLGEYLPHAKAHLKPSTYERVDDAVHNNLLPALGHLVVSRVTPGDLQRFVDKRSQDTVNRRRWSDGKIITESGRIKPHTVLREIIMLSAIFREARKRGLVDRNPVSLVTKPRADNTIVRFLAPEEEEGLRVFLSPFLQDAVTVAIHSGLREGEQAKLTWADVRFGERAIVVRDTKTRKDRVIPMSNTLFETLQNLPRHLSSPYVFASPQTGDRLDRFNNSAWKRAIRSSGLHGFRWHDLRHTCASRMVQRGVPLIAVKEIMGHTDIKTTLRYAHLAPANLRAAVEALDAPPQGVQKAGEHAVTTPLATPKKKATG